MNLEQQSQNRGKVLTRTAIGCFSPRPWLWPISSLRPLRSSCALTRRDAVALSVRLRFSCPGPSHGQRAYFATLRSHVL